MNITDKGDYIEYYAGPVKTCVKEDIEQINAVAWVKYNHPECIVFHAVNEGKKTMHSALRDEQAGLLKGVADFSIILPNGMFAAIELKRAGKTQASPVSEEQKAFLRGCRERGCFASVAYGLEAFKAAFKDCLNSTNC
jgi:hypothetical protein